LRLPAVRGKALALAAAEFVGAQHAVPAANAWQN
jgi:hypothetical protein